MLLWFVLYLVVLFVCDVSCCFLFFYLLCIVWKSSVVFFAGISCPVRALSGVALPSSFRLVLCFRTHFGCVCLLCCGCVVWECVYECMSV